MESATSTDALAESPIDFGAPADFGVAVVAKAKHADLWRAAKKLGGQSALARHLGVGPSELGDWCNLKSMPRFEEYESVDGRKVRPKFSDPELRQNIERRLYELTGKTLDELFPPEVRNNQEFLNQPKTQEFYTTIDLKKLGSSVPDRFFLPCPTEQAIDKEHRAMLADSMKKLSERERRIIEMRFGMNDNPQMTLEEVGHVMRVGRERVRQIEARAIRKMQLDVSLREEEMLP